MIVSIAEAVPNVAMSTVLAGGGGGGGGRRI